MAIIDPDTARDVLKVAFPFTEKTTQKFAVYRNPKGREIAVQRERSESFYVWLERYDIELPGIVVKNEKFPGQPYDRKQSRNSNLNDTMAPRLKVGHKVWYVQVDGLTELQQLVDWYKSV